MASRQQITDQLLSAKTQAEKEGRHEFDEIVAIVFNVFQPLSITALSQLTGQSNDTLKNTLHLLDPLVLVPDDLNSPLQIGQHPHYCRVPDEGASPPIYDAEADTKIIAQCLRLMDGLHANMCGLESYGTRMADIPSKTIERSISPGLAYACQHLVIHLRETADPAKWMDRLLRFLERHLLHLMETMTILIGGAPEALNMLQLLLGTFADNEGSPLVQFLHAACDFLQRDWHIACLYPLQLYASALVLEPDSSLIKRALIADLPCWLGTPPRMEDPPEDPDRGRFVGEFDESSTAGHTDPVLALTFSPDGRLAASASGDHTAALWDTGTGMLRHKLRGHATCVWHVTFSPDGRLLASGAEDQSVRLWDTRTGCLRHALCTDRLLDSIDSYRGSMTGVVFSPDGRTLAVEICDDRVWLWDVATGALRQTLNCHGGASQALAFSPDGRRVTSGSEDHSIQIWDVATGTLQQTLRGHRDWVTDVGFSPDGRRLVSAGADRTVRLWDVEGGTLEQTLRNDTNGLDAPDLVGFSPDGRLVVSGGFAAPVQLWDPRSGELLHVVEGSRLEGILLIGGVSRRSSYVESATGCVDLGHWLPGDPSPYPEVILTQSWVRYEGRREMYLPHAYQFTRATAYRDGILALGSSSGRVIFLGFGKE